MREIDINQLKSIQIEILDHVADFCNANGIRYFLSSGTLIGAVRHGGYIPWDDDIDLYLPRKDYEIFLDSFNNSSNHCYYVLSACTDKDYCYPFAKVEDTSTVMIEENELDNRKQFGVNIDLFPVDAIPDSPLRRAIKLTFVKYSTKLCEHTLSKHSGRMLFWSLNSLVRLRDWADRLFDSSSSKYVRNLTCKGNRDFLRTSIDESVDIGFEGKLYKTMAGYDDYLTATYGNYMTPPPPEQRVSNHHFRAYFKDSKPMVSILVPVYGVENYIKDCAESLFGQSYENIEYVIVDDCTPDHSIKVLRSALDKYKNRKDSVKIIHHSENKGLGAARLTGLENATGDYVMFVDSDDLLPLDAVEKLVAGVCESNADMVDGAFRITGQNKTYLPWHHSNITYLNAILLQNIVKNNIWARLFRRSIFMNSGLQPVEGIDYAEDYCLLSKVVSCASRSWIDDVVYYYRDDNLSSYTNSISEKHILSNVRALANSYSYLSKCSDSLGSADCLHFSLLNAYRLAKNNHFSLETIDDYFEELGISNDLISHQSYVKVLKKGLVPDNLADFFFKAIRSIYKFRYVYGKR